MTLNILFFTVTIKKRKLSTKEIFQEEMIKNMIEDNRNRQVHFQRLF